MDPSDFEFVKGHMGGNEIVLIYGDHVQKKIPPKAVISILKPPHIRGDIGVGKAP
ncbi:hypothetical protein K9M78_07585 [Candidatus Bipolaricaulota bacterium]|nr:hypothetical protein [Candidatus Bipolaricaulota bacterium]